MCGEKYCKESAPKIDVVTKEWCDGVWTGGH